MRRKKRIFKRKAKQQTQKAEQSPHKVEKLPEKTAQHPINILNSVEVKSVFAGAAVVTNIALYSNQSLFWALALSSVSCLLFIIGRKTSSKKLKTLYFCLCLFI